MRYKLKRLLRSSILASAFFVCALAVSTTAKAQEDYQFHEVDSQLRQMFGSLCRDTNGPQFLYDMAAHSLDSIWFTDFNPDTLVRDYWFTIYDEVRRSGYDTTTIPLPMDSVFVRGMQWEPDTVTMNFLAYNTNRIIDSMLDVDYYDIDTINNTITDKTPCEINPFYTQRVFAACPIEIYAPSDEPVFRIDTAFFFHDKFNNLFDSNWTLRIDFGDGSGWHNYSTALLTMPQYYSPTYPSGVGWVYIKTEVITGSSIVKMSSVSKLRIPNYANKRKNPDEVITVLGAKAGVYNPCSESGGPLKKTIIVLEGWDPGDMFPGSNTDIKEIYENLVVDGNLESLRNFGYTFVVVDWWDSRRDIKDNAATLERLLDYLKCQQQVNQDDTGTHEQFVIVAHSMGGLVARYAMCEMEDKASTNSLGGCLPQKMHNVRELITFDTPHDGANMPLAFQLVYRDIGKYLLGVNTLTQRITGGMLGLLLDSKAAKQMLLYHVDTKSGSSYSAHSDRTSFTSDLAAIGNYPQYAKLFALSNGNMHGVGQYRIYDTVERTPNDYFLNYTSFLKGRMFGLDFRVFEQSLVLRSLPNGSGNLLTLNRSTFHPKVKFKLKAKSRWPWPPKITLDVSVEDHLSTSNSLTHNGSNLQPYDVIPGSNEDFNGQITKNRSTLNTRAMGTFFGFASPEYDESTHTWTHARNDYIGKKDQFGSTMGASLYTDGLHYCFIPNFSAMDYSLPSNDYWYDIAGDNATANVGRTPFDVIMGQVDDRYPLIINRYNHDHYDIRNPQLQTFMDNEPNTPGQQYPACGESGPRQNVYLLNREIGDDSLFIENRTTHWSCLYDAERFTGVNIRSPYYAYPTATGSQWIFPGVFSKENSYSIDAGTSYFAATGFQDSVNANIPITSGSYTFLDIAWVKCCETSFGMTSSVKGYVEKAKAGTFKIIPNPVIDNEVIFEFSATKDKASQLQVYDILGKKLVDKSFVITEDKEQFKFHLTLNNDLPNGTYFVLIKNGNEIYRSKFVKQ